jgi:alginate O-acetyltransferase complex protein AlgI
MLFNSFQFLFFFIVVWLLFLVTRGTTRKIILLVASYYFYMCWSTRYIFVIWGITLDRLLPHRVAPLRSAL